VILDPNAVVNPRAMVIEAFDATVANGTVARASGSYHFAFWTEICWVDVS